MKEQKQFIKQKAIKKIIFDATPFIIIILIASLGIFTRDIPQRIFVDLFVCFITFPPLVWTWHKSQVDIRNSKVSEISDFVLHQGIQGIEMPKIIIEGKRWKISEELYEVLLQKDDAKWILYYTPHSKTIVAAEKLLAEISVPDEDTPV